MSLISLGCFIMVFFNLVYFFRAVRELRWLAEATYTGEALGYSWDNMIHRLGADHSNSVVLVLTDGRSDTKRDKVPLNTLCGRGLQVRKAHLYLFNYILLTRTFGVKMFSITSNMI